MRRFIETVAFVAAATVYTAAAFAQSTKDTRGPSPAQVTRIEVKPDAQPVNTVRGTSPEGGSMQAQTSNLFRLEDLENGTKTQ